MGVLNVTTGESSGLADTAGSPRRLTDMVVEEPRGAQTAPTRDGWIRIGVLAALIGIFYRSEIMTLVDQWQALADWSHGFVIPIFSLYLLYAWRRELLNRPHRIGYFGLAIVLLAVCMRVIGLQLLPNVWIRQLSIPVMIFGVVWYLTGWRVAIAAAVPIFYLVLAMPLPDSIYRSISTPLQELAADVSTRLMRLFGTKMDLVGGSTMIVTSISGELHELQVAEACSGMRSLMAFFALGVAMAYVEQRPFWQRLVVILMGIPIAIFCNILRVTATSTMFVIDEPDLGRDVMHTMMGMVLLIPALILLFLLTRVLDRLYVEEDDEDESQEPRDGQPASEAPEATS